MKKPSHTLLHAALEPEPRAWIVQTECPYQAGRDRWYELLTVDVYVMNYFSADEVMVLGFVKLHLCRWFILAEPFFIRAILSININNLLCIYNKWGPDARHCVHFTEDPKLEYPHELRVVSAADTFIKLFPSAKTYLYPSLPVDSKLLFSILPEDLSWKGRQFETVQVASNHIDDLILNAFIKAETAEQIAFFSSLRTHPWFKAPASHILKALILAWLSAHPVTTSIHCKATLAEAPTLEIPACHKNRAFSLTALTSLGDINKHLSSSPFCFLPTSHTFPGPTQAIDAIVVNNNNLITVQVCTSSEVYADLETFRTIWQNLPHTIRQTHKWCHVFVTSMHRTAKQLRNQSMMNQVMNPLGVDIFYYSAVFEVDLFKEQLDLIHQRLDEVVSGQ